MDRHDKLRQEKTIHDNVIQAKPRQEKETSKQIQYNTIPKQYNASKYKTT